MASPSQYGLPAPARPSFRTLAISAIDLTTSLTVPSVLLAFLFFQPFFDFSRNEVLDPAKHILLRAIAIGVLVYTFMYASGTKGIVRFPSSGVGEPLALYSASAVLSVVLAFLASRAEGGRAVTSLLTFPILISLIYTIPFWFRTKESVVRAAKVFLFSVGVVAMIGLCQVLLEVFTPGGEGFRVRSIYYDPNIFARFLVIGIFFLLSLLFISERRVMRTSHLVLLLCVCLVTLLFSLSRSGYATLFIGCFLFAVLARNKRVTLIIVPSTILVACGAVIFLLLERRFTGSFLIEPSNINRVQLVLGGIELIREHWLMGVGYTNFAHMFETTYLTNTFAITQASYEMLGYQTSIHNWLIEVWAEQGVIGVVAYLWLFVALFKGLNKARHAAGDATHQALLLAYVLMLFVFVFHGFFYHTFISQFFFWVVTGFAISAQHATEAGDGV